MSPGPFLKGRRWTEPFLIACLALSMGSAAAASAVESGSCGPVELMDGGGIGSGKSRRPALVWAEPVEAPPLSLRFLSRGDGPPLVGVEISVCYDWRWFQYPYPEKLFGAWKIAYECRRCRLDGEGAVKVPAHPVKPRGWYDGWLRFGRSPQFLGMRVNLDHRGHNLSFPRLTGADLQRLSRDGADPIRIERADIAVTAAHAEDPRARKTP